MVNCLCACSADYPDSAVRALASLSYARCVVTASVSLFFYVVGDLYAIKSCTSSVRDSLALCSFS